MACQAGDLNLVLEAVPEQEGHAEKAFAAEPSKAKKGCAPAAGCYSSEPGIDHKSSACCSLVGGRLLTWQEAIGSTGSTGELHAQSRWRLDAASNLATSL